MRRQSYRRDLVVWNSSAGPADGYRAPKSRRPARTRPIHRWIRTGALFTVIGLMRLPGTVRTRGRLTLLLAGGVLTVAGVALSSGVVFIPGMLVLLLAPLIRPDSSTAFSDPALMPFLVDAQPDRPAAR